MGIGSMLRRWIVADVHLWVALAAAAIFLLAELLHVVDVDSWQAPPRVAFVAIIICLVAIVVDRLHDADHVHETHERVRRIAESFYEKRAGLRKKPTKLEEYESVWGGFTGEYFAYNPCFDVDENIGDDDVVSAFVRRYENTRFKKARYLFLTRDGTKDLDRFRGLLANVRKRYSSVEKKVEVRTAAGKDASSAAELYFGERDGDPTAVLEPKDPALGPRRGKPRYYLIIHDKTVIDEHLKTFFEDEWDKAAPFKLS